MPRTPLTTQTIKVGMHVRCIYDGYGRYEKTARVIRLDTMYDTVYVVWDDGHPSTLIWGSSKYFEEFTGQTITYVPLTRDNIKIGLRVQEVDGARTGVIADIGRAEFHSGNFIILWDHSGVRGNWSTYRNFHIIVTGKIRLRKRKPKKVIPDIPMDTTMPLLMAGYMQDRARKKFK